jgi:hypothetical protein
MGKKMREEVQIKICLFGGSELFRRGQETELVVHLETKYLTQNNNLLMCDSLSKSIELG